jgi:cytidylate kinase
MAFRYKNITISGLPGSGSTTLLKLLREKYEQDGWKGFSGGEFMRQYAVEQGLFDGNGMLHHDATVYNDDFDRKVDGDMRNKLATEEKWILESWLSGFLAQGLPGVLKVLVYCSSDAVRIDRIVNRDKVTVDEAKAHIMQRTEKNLAKWSRMYANEWQQWVVQPGVMSASEPIDFWNPALYDVTIDTFKYSREEAFEKVLEVL